MHALGDALFGGMEPVSPGEIKAAVQALLFSSNGRIALHYERTWTELVGRAAGMAAVVESMTDGPIRLSDISRRTELATGGVATMLKRLGEAVVKEADGRYALADPVFARWIQWRMPGGVSVPMRILGDEAELAAAEGLAARGFELVYPSRVSRGSFDLLAIRHGLVLGIQVKRTSMPARLRKAEIERIEAGGWADVKVAGPVRLVPSPASRRSSWG